MLTGIKKLLPRSLTRAISRDKTSPVPITISHQDTIAVNDPRFSGMPQKIVMGLQPGDQVSNYGKGNYYVQVAQKSMPMKGESFKEWLVSKERDK